MLPEVGVNSQVRLQKLLGPLQRYNGELGMVREWSDDGRCLVEVVACAAFANTPRIEFLLNNKYMGEYEDTGGKRQNLEKKFRRNEMTGNNRSNVKVAMEGVGTQIRAAFAKLAVERVKKGQRWIRKMFEEYDKDGNGTIDKDEFLFLLNDRMDVEISMADLELIWSMFDADESGGIEYDEFIGIINPSSQPEYHRPEYIIDMERASKQQRTKRISNASMHRRSRYGSISSVGRVNKRRSPLPVLSPMQDVRKPSPPPDTEVRPAKNPASKGRMLKQITP